MYRAAQAEIDTSSTLLLPSTYRSAGPVLAFELRYTYQCLERSSTDRSHWFSLPWYRWL
jgi:hypothetical protein